MVLYILIAILMFGLLIAVHEFGHFFVAKLCNVKVNEFAIGMGPKLLHKQKGETLYTLRALPIGGFCAMEGEDGDSQDPRAFGNIAGWKRFLILVAGAGMNFLTGLVIIFFLFLAAGLPGKAVVTSYIEGTEAMMADAPVKPGDELYKVDGHRIYFTEDASLYLDRAGDRVDLELIRDGEHIVLKECDFPRKFVVKIGDQVAYKRGINLGVPQEVTAGSLLAGTWYQSIDYVRLVWMSLGDLVTGAVGLRDMSGAIGIVQIIGQAGEAGAQAAAEAGIPQAAGAAVNIFQLVAFIAINLAVMNLLPIPALDGGRIFFLVVGGVYTLLTKRRLNPKFESYVNVAGLVCLLGLMAVLAVSDVMKLI